MSVYFDVEDKLWRLLVVASVDPGFRAEKGTGEGELVNVNARQLDGVVLLRRQGVKRLGKGVGDGGDESLEEISCKEDNPFNVSTWWLDVQSDRRLWQAE